MLYTVSESLIKNFMIPKEFFIICRGQVLKTILTAIS